MSKVDDELKKLEKEVESWLSPKPIGANGRLNALLSNIKNRKLNGGKTTQVKKEKTSLYR